jgi:Na+/H+-dicarboxylate symporter
MLKKMPIVLLFIILVFMLLFRAVSKLASNATRMIACILGAVVCSNFISIMISQMIGRSVFNLGLEIALPADMVGLAPAWTFVFPKLLPNNYAMFGGIILGLLGSKFAPNLTNRISQVFDRGIHILLQMIVRVIPFFVAGFAVKLMHDQLLQSIAQHYSLIFLIVALSQISYICFLFLAVNNFQLSGFVRCLKNLVPPAVAGFSSMSSAATMPLTLIAAEKNTQNPTLVRLVIPTTVNIHLMGCCFAIPILAFAVMRNFGFPEPTYPEYMIFAMYFLIAKFSTAGIPGGGILIMLPILESHFGFNPQMAALISALYILLDPMTTCSNILGNSALAQVIHRVTSRVPTWGVTNGP